MLRSYASTQQVEVWRKWLWVTLLLVLSMICLGGVTRLTESGLSIVEWKLLSGIFPPLTQSAWVQEFSAYQKTPEYMLKNMGMDLAGFKQIFWLEYLHRLLGRIIGLWIVIPTILLLFCPNAPRWLKKSAIIMSLLVVSQGVVGWLMVHSGLQDQPYVSPLRLATHLMLATCLFLMVLYALMRLYPTFYGAPTASVQRIGLLAVIVVMIQMMLGAFVAGMDAGLTYNTYPLMDGAFIPDYLLPAQTDWSMWFTHIPLVQFQHRWWAVLASVVVLCYSVALWRAQRKHIAVVIMVVLFLQFVLGVATLLMMVPITLGALHQLGAFALLAVLFVPLVRPRVMLKGAPIDSEVQEIHHKNIAIIGEVR